MMPYVIGGLLGAGVGGLVLVYALCRIAAVSDERWARMLEEEELGPE